jgi:hypothetical protein
MRLKEISSPDTAISTKEIGAMHLERPGRETRLGITFFMSSKIPRYQSSSLLS